MNANFSRIMASMAEFLNLKIGVFIIFMQICKSVFDSFWKIGVPKTTAVSFLPVECSFEEINILKELEMFQKRKNCVYLSTL